MIASPLPRFEVWDDAGVIRRFFTQERARNFCLEGMWVVVLPKLSKREQIVNKLSSWEEAPF